MDFLIEIWPITLTAIFVLLLVFVGLMYRLPHAATPENMWQQASRYPLHYPGFKGPLIKYLFRFTLVTWPVIALLNALFVFKVI